MVESNRSVLHWVATAIAALAMIPLGFLMLTSGLVAPWWAMLMLLALWVLAIWIMWRLPAWWRLAVPVALFAIWFLIISFGDAVLGWQA